MIRAPDLTRKWMIVAQVGSYTKAAIILPMIGDAPTVADHVRLLEYCVSDQISIFSAISIASSTSMPR